MRSSFLLALKMLVLSSVVFYFNDARADRTYGYQRCPTELSRDTRNARCHGTRGQRCAPTLPEEIILTCRAPEGGSTTTIQLLNRPVLLGPCRERAGCSYGGRTHLKIGDLEIPIPGDVPGLPGCPNMDTYASWEEELRQYYDQPHFLDTATKINLFESKDFQVGQASGRLLIAMAPPFSSRIESELLGAIPQRREVGVLVDLRENGRRRTLFCRNQQVFDRVPAIRRSPVNLREARGGVLDATTLAEARRVGLPIRPIDSTLPEPTAGSVPPKRHFQNPAAR